MKLIIINGPAGVGKSTVARRIHQDMPLSVYIDVDEIRKNINNYAEERRTSGLLAFEISLKIVSCSLENGHDVILDKMMYEFIKEDRSRDIIDDYISCGNMHDAEIHEIILWADLNTVQERSFNRGYQEPRIMTHDRVEHFYEKISSYRLTRENANILDTSTLTRMQVYDNIKRIIV